LEFLDERSAHFARCVIKLNYATNLFGDRGWRAGVGVLGTEQ
jgi:hypothetical protein